MTARFQKVVPKITVWRAIFAAILLSGAYATYLRIFYGLGGSTNLSDKFPWGLWIGFDVMCGVGLAAGAGFASPPLALLGFGFSILLFKINNWWTT